MVPFSKVLDLFLPPRCISCQEIVTQTQSLCPICWEKARFITQPCCACCGLPFEYATEAQTLCLDCTCYAPPFVAARSVFPYDDFSRSLILAFKHGDRTDLAPTLGGWMVQSARDLIKDSDIIIPVPLHWRRLAKRRYNQAALLAKEIAKRTTLPMEPTILKRVRHTPVQGHLSRMARQKNLKGAFTMTQRLEGKRVLLVDDVLTTGATILNCTQTLLNHGVSEVRIITLARVLCD